MKSLSLTLCAAAAIGSLAPAAFADEGGRRRPAAVTSAEDREFAARETASPNSRRFEGGCGVCVVLLVFYGVSAVLMILLMSLIPWPRC